MKYVSRFKTNRCRKARIVALNAHQFLKTGGGFLISVKASCVDSTATPEAVYAMEVRAGARIELRAYEKMCIFSASA